ncbi:hypothetical protein [Polaribacter ponticola]|uniref:Chemotaxis methyl-accepting receptor HlyB-like 4HB MCP domain-containing protein n=1 Tax=Polaribacter ponticola TaxID=2978475 RepID=A0ABT5SAZ8_9FLAO|nr:hypothetical protein [Polaribacter sp. MSW5]MDD7914656.1 hypothetical protein [Polaribacter sp. MSW5]
MYFLIKNTDNLAESQEVRYKSFKLASELRTHSKELTDFARLYVMTGDSFYEQEYEKSLKVAHGAIPRPDGRTISILDSLRNLGVKKIEFDLLKSSQELSDQLVLVEKMAFNTMKDNLKENVNFSELKEKSNLESARNSLFDERYNSSLKRIIDPLDIFVKVIEDRNNQVLETFKTKRVIIIVVSILLFLISSSFIFLLKRDNNTDRNNKSVT